MTLIQLAYAVAVDDFKSFQTASKKKFVTQPTLSMQIQKLEEELGVIIFDRSNYPIKTTSAGKKIIEQARCVLLEASKIHEIISAESNEVKGKFRLGIIPTVAPYLLPLFLEDFVGKYPDLELVIDETDTHSIIDKIRKDELDAAVLATPLSEKDIVEIPLFYEPFVAYVSEKHRLFNHKTIQAKELRLNDMFLLKEGHCFRDQVINLCSSYNNPDESGGSLIGFEGGTIDTLMKLVEKNFGMTLIPYLLALELKSTSKSNYIRYIEEPVPKREVSIVHRSIFTKKNIVKVLKNEILDFLPEDITMNDGMVLNLY